MISYVALIAGAISLLEKLIPLIAQWREAAKQTGEMTPEQEAEFKAKIETVTSQPWWKPEPDEPTPLPTPTPNPTDPPIPS